MRRGWAALVVFGSFLEAFAGPAISAKSAIVMDADSGMVLFQKGAMDSRFPASTTKIMTALLMLENMQPSDVLVAAPDVAEVQGSSLHLVPGEKISRDDALYALMLRSANDVAHSAAVQISGSDEKFAELMNQRAKEIGCSNTNFRNPHGLNHELHSTTAFDLALIAREAMKNDTFRQIVATQKKYITRSINMKDLLMINHNKLLSSDSTMDGIKTGYTVPAGQCFVGSKSIGGWRLLTVVLASKDWKTDTQTLYKWAYSKFERKEGLRPGQVLGDAPVEGGNAPSVPARLDRGFAIVAKRGDLVRGPEIEWRELKAPVAEGDTVGIVKAKAPDGSVVQAPLVAAAAVDSVSVLDPRRGLPWWLFVGLIGGAGVFWGRKRLRFRNA